MCLGNHENSKAILEMKTSQHVKGIGSVVIIENPFTGTSSVAKLLGAQRPKGAHFAMVPEKARATMSKKKWSNATKVIVVRDVRQRFLSGAATFLADGLVESVDDLLTRLENFDSESEEAEWLRLLSPQSRWLTCNYQIVLTTGSIANFANHHQFGVSVFPRSNSPEKPRLTEAQIERVNALYQEDFEVFEKLRVWHPDPSQVWTLSGHCHSCTEKLAAKVSAESAETDSETKGDLPLDIDSLED